MLQITQLQSLGLSASEGAVYLDVAEIGKATAQAISKRTKLPRTTVYWLLENLASKGLVTIEKKKDTSFYSANQPEALLRMVREEKRKLLKEIDEREALAEELQESIRPFFKGSQFNIPKLQMFEGQSAVTSLLYDYTPIWQKSMEQYDHTWWGYQDPTFPENYLDWMKATWKVKKENEHYKILTNRADVEKKLALAAPFRKMKFFPANFKLSSTIWVLGDYIVLIMTAQKPHYAFQLRDPLFSNNLRTIFQVVWETQQ